MKYKEIHEAIKAKMFHGRKRVVSPRGSGYKYTRLTLAELLGELNYNVGAEIGVRRGAFTRHLFKCNPFLKMYCIDPWFAYSKYSQERQDRIFQEYLVNTQNLNIQTFRMTSMQALEHVPDRSLDFIFIDGNHDFDFIMLDLLYWPVKVKGGGIIMVHDYYPFGDNGVLNAVNAYTSSHHIDPWYVTKELEPTAYWVNL